MNFSRLNTLRGKINEGTSTESENLEFINLLHAEGSMPDKIMQDYKGSGDKIEILKAANIIAGIILLGHILMMVAEGRIKL